MNDHLYSDIRDIAEQFMALGDFARARGFEAVADELWSRRAEIVGGQVPGFPTDEQVEEVLGDLMFERAAAERKAA